MSNEDRTIIPECFRQFEKFPGTIFKDGKILFSNYSNILLFLHVFVGILLLCGLIYLISISKVNKFFSFVLLSGYLVAYIICAVNINVYTTIDYKNNLLYKELCLFGKSLFTFGYVEIEDILQVSNNVIPCITNPEGKNNRVRANSKTNLFHMYVVSFLVNNGDIIDFIKLGAYEEYFEVSKNLAKAISSNWGIPLLICNENQKLYVAGVEERYHLALEGIPYSYSRSVFISICIVVILVVFIGSCLR